ncbi:MAG TPA: putative lipid II flippase FtsW [Pyrinomonadaceae bacterium]|jgi:cell division protein FtsW
MAKKLQADEWLFAAAVGLALFGVVMVYSASAPVAAQENGTPYHYVVRQGVSTLLGFGALLVAMRTDYALLRQRWLAIGLLGLTVALLLSVFAFPRINGAHRWLRFGGLISFQPSELAKLVLAVCLARFLERRAGEERDLWRTFLPAVALTGLLVVLVAAEPDLGTAMMLGVVGLTMLFAAGARARHIGLMLAPALVGVVAMIAFAPWRVKRLLAFLDPWADAQGAGFQVVQSLMAVGSGGVHGLGFAQGRQKLFFLPFAHSDFIFAVVGEELGLIGALLLVGAFGLFLWRGVRAARRAPDRFGMLLGLGIVTGIVAQALFNLSVVLALVPTKGIPLPFVSYGGTSTVFTLFAVGVLLNISQQGGATGEQAAWGVEQAEGGTQKTTGRLRRQPWATYGLLLAWGAGATSFWLLTPDSRLLF